MALQKALIIMNNRDQVGKIKEIMLEITKSVETTLVLHYFIVFPPKVKNFIHCELS